MPHKNIVKKPTTYPARLLVHVFTGRTAGSSVHWRRKLKYLSYFSKISTADRSRRREHQKFYTQDNKMTRPAGATNRIGGACSASKPVPRRPCVCWFAARRSKRYPPEMLLPMCAGLGFTLPFTHAPKLWHDFFQKFRMLPSKFHRLLHVQLGHLRCRPPKRT